jgi:hypothetical protein
MWSQYRYGGSDKREGVLAALYAHGYRDAFPADSDDERAFVVVHPDFYAGRVAYPVDRLDPVHNGSVRQAELDSAC